MIKEKIINAILAEKQYELDGMYNSEMEHMIAEKKMEWRNELIDEIIDIIKREFKDIEDMEEKI